MPHASKRADDPEQQLTDLFTAHHRQVVAYVARRTRPLGDQPLAQDVAAEVFALAWQRVSASGAGERPRIDLAWLLVTAGNALSQRTRDDARRLAREERAMTDRAMVPEPNRAATDPADALALSEQVARALDRMQPGDRELLLLRVWDELSFAQAAAVLGCSPGAARVRWLRARRRFAAALMHEDGDWEPAPGPAASMPAIPLTVTEGDAR